MGKLVALCFVNKEQGKTTLLKIPDHQGLLSDIDVKTQVKSSTDLLGFDYSFSIYDTGKAVSDGVGKEKYKAYKIFHNGFCLGTCRRQGINNDPQWCLKGTSGGKLVCGNDPGDDPLARFYFKDGFMKCSGNTTITIPVDIFILNTTTGGSFTLGSRVNVTDYTLTLKTPLFSVTQPDDPQISKTNFNTEFGNMFDSDRDCSFSSPSYVPSGSYNSNLEYVNVKFNKAPIWSTRQTGDNNIVRNLCRNDGYKNSYIFYLLELSSSQRVPSKLVVFLENGCYMKPQIWNLGAGSSSKYWTNLESASELDMNKYNFEKKGSPSTNVWFGSSDGKKAFVVDLPDLKRSKTQFSFEINNGSNSSMYGMQFMFLDADGQIVDRGSDLLETNPNKFLCYDQLIRLWGDTFRQATFRGQNRGFAPIFVASDTSIRSNGSEFGSSSIDITANTKENYFIYDPRDQKLKAISDGTKEIDLIVALRGSQDTGTSDYSYGLPGDRYFPESQGDPNAYTVRVFKDWQVPGDAGRWIMEPRSNPETEKVVTFKSKIFPTNNSNKYLLGVEGGGSQWGWDYSNRNILIGRPDVKQSGFVISLPSTRP